MRVGDTVRCYSRATPTGQPDVTGVIVHILPMGLFVVQHDHPYCEGWVLERAYYDYADRRRHHCWNYGEDELSKYDKITHEDFEEVYCAKLHD